jgi:hypothetical protein
VAVPVGPEVAAQVAVVLVEDPVRQRIEAIGIRH